MVVPAVVAPITVGVNEVQSVKFLRVLVPPSKETPPVSLYRDARDEFIFEEVFVKLTLVGEVVPAPVIAFVLVESTAQQAIVRAEPTEIAEADPEKNVELLK